jgi:uncharacterized membrane protein YeaQ/YmgE (transglycosylase-associated protein family)
MNVLWFLLVGVIAGWLAGVLVKGGGFGLIGDLVVGIIGALIGGLFFSGLDVACWAAFWLPRLVQCFYLWCCVS